MPKKRLIAGREDFPQTQATVETHGEGIRLFTRQARALIIVKTSISWEVGRRVKPFG